MYLIPIRLTRQTCLLRRLARQPELMAMPILSVLQAEVAGRILAQAREFGLISSQIWGEIQNGTGGYNAGSPIFPNRDHTFNDHYTTDGVALRFGDGNANTTVELRAFQDLDTLGNDSVVDVDRVGISVTSISISIGSVTQFVDFAVVGEAPTSVTFGSRTYVVGFQDQIPGNNGQLLVGRVQGIMDALVTISTFTQNGYNSLEVLNVSGDDFAITGIGAAVPSADPVHFTVPVELT